MLPFPQQPRAAPASAAPNSAQHRDALVEEARKRHYQDLPWGTAALGGGLAGLGIPLALVGLTRPDLFRQPTQLAGLLGATTLAGAGTGVGMEALGRVLTRAAGPSFEPKRWHRDQDPHRWNSAVRTAPLIAALLAGRTIPTVLQEIKQAGAVDQDLRARIAAAEAQVEIPTPEQIESGNYRKGHCTVQGLPITLETAKGQTRSGQDKTGKAWSIQLKNSYGYIKRTSSAEIGDQMDIFLGPFPESQIVFVVDQNKTSGKFDEHKTIVGARTSQEAKDIYHVNYSAGWKGFRDCTALTMEQFKAWLKHGDMKVPLAGQQFSTFYKKANINRSNEKERKVTPAKRVQSILPWLGGGALGVAGLSEVARRGAFTPELLQDMSSFSQKLDNDQIFKPYAHLPEGEQNVQAMVDYAVQGNRLLNNRLWGFVSPTSIIKGLRSLPGLKEDDKWNSLSQQHYDTFERSPAGGFVRALGEISHGGWGAADPTYTQARGDAIRKAIREATNATAGLNYADTSGGKPSWNFPTVGFPEQLSRDQQMVLMRNMAPALKKHITEQPDGSSLWDTFSKYLRDGRQTVYNGYSRITDNLQHINSGWGAANTALAGVGVAGLGGYGLWRYLENKHKQDTKKRQKQSSMKQIHIANYLIKRAGFLEDLKTMATQPNEEQFRKLLRDKIRSNAMTTLAIAGGAPVLGALSGAGIQALRRSDTDKPKDRPSLLNGALLGGVLGLGGGMVGGAAHLIDNYRQTWNDTPLGKRGPIDLPRFWSSVLGGNKPTPMAW